MAKAKKSDASDDQDIKPKTDVSEDVVDAEIVEEIEADPAEAAVEDTQDDPVTDDDETPSSDDVADELDATETVEDNPSEPDLAEDPATPQPPVTEPTPQKSGGIMPLLIGGILAGAIGFGAASVPGLLPSGPDEATLAMQEQLATQAQDIDALKSQDATSALTALADGTATLQGSVDGLTASLAGINQKFDDVSAALAGLDSRIIELEKRPLTQGLPSSAIKAYERELEDLKASVAEQRAEAAAMEENAKLTAQQALARAALTRVLSALDAGQGFRAPLTDLVTATGTPAPQILDDLADSGVVSLATLQSSYPEAARAALAAARKVEGTSGNRFLSFMQSQLGARSVTPQEGDGADAVLSRAEAALRTGNLTDVLAELGTLPDPAKPAIAAWLETAKTRQAALSAGNALSAQLNSN